MYVKDASDGSLTGCAVHVSCDIFAIYFFPNFVSFNVKSSAAKLSQSLFQNLIHQKY